MRSEVAIFDLAAGTATTVLATERLVEAPNWSRDGRFLIVNSEGRLYRVPLDAPRMIEVDTGFAKLCNNDHGISPDGRTLVISDSTQLGQSCLYTLPIGGGTPLRVQDTPPAYWHGWSPDGQTLAYVAKRGSVFQVYTCPANGGAEVQVTRDFEHTDGPDYSPDGQWIWFNGEIRGSVQLWRIRPGGGDPTQMTRDDRVNWFPHPSPDGRWVLYLAFANGTKGHPSNQEVELRLIAATGGAPKALLPVFGGQGTINVPCWSPDSRQFAFVRFARP